MELLDYVPSWDDIERNLDHQFSELNQSANEGWDGFTRRLSEAPSQAYGAMGGHRIDNVRQAMALSYPIMQMNLSRKWASINIVDILPVLLKLVQEVVMILGGSVAIGGAAGGAVGSLGFGVGAVPGAIIGGGIGLQVGNLILIGLGLGSIAKYFYYGLPACLAILQEGLAIAWTAEDGVKPAGLDPSGGSAAVIQERTERAARQLARGQEQLVLLLLTAIVTYLTRGQVKAGLMNSMDSIAARSASLQAQISNKEFANWLARNERRILDEPGLHAKDEPRFRKIDPEREAMMEHYAKQDKDFVPLEKQINSTETFEPIGVRAEEIEKYLKTEEGTNYIREAAAADPTKSAGLIYERVRGQLASGKELPTSKIVSHPLIKIVAEGGGEPKFSPYFTTYEEFKKAASSQQSLADMFGLPVVSEGSKYTIYEITPFTPAKVYVSEIAKTVELGGTIERTGGATQYIVPNRGLWAPARPIGFIGN
ncbi:DUF6861 domain-containing protein [Pseudomonas sp. LP_7_YM]|uniref:DUF6861 domain-containing protein n=1 Tax=Pseudomonas sp. LP_7_YM TaxID=2485137 RepID=UPI00105F55F1|nr:hypothetical protein [Pseudomonas sp. LP_7_YM]TDV58965.1 hypothetical protein EC915_12116 [Pseudomonas sp. LP_7_YM]